MSKYSGKQCDFFLHTVITIDGVDHVLEKGMAVFCEDAKGYLNRICKKWEEKGKPLEFIFAIGQTKFKLRKNQPSDEQKFDFEITETSLLSNTAETAKSESFKPNKNQKNSQVAEQFEDDIPF